MGVEDRPQETLQSEDEYLRGRACIRRQETTEEARTRSHSIRQESTKGIGRRRAFHVGRQEGVRGLEGV